MTRAFSGPRTTQNDQCFALQDVEADAVKNLAFAIADAQVAQRNRCCGMRGLRYLVRWHHLLRGNHWPPEKKKRVVKNKSTKTTRKMDMTTARVVARPTCSAPPAVRSPSRQPTAVMVIANITLLISPVVMSRSSRESIEALM